MPAPPARASLFPTGALTPSLFKSYLRDFYDYAVELMGSDGSQEAAREALNVPLLNYLDNPDGAIYQATVAATADDVYADDRWYLLTQTGSVTPSQVSNPEDGYRYGLRLTQSQVAAQRMGRAQIVPGDRTSELRGKTVTFGGRLKLSTSANLRVALLAWTGAEDAVTSDVVNSWASGTYTAGNFFNSTTLTVIDTASQAMSAGNAADVSVSGTVPSNATNLIVLYWTEATAAQNVTLDAWGMRVVTASSLVDYIRRTMDGELERCRMFQQLLQAVAPGQIVTTTIADFQFQFVTAMRASPTLYLPSRASLAGGSTPDLRIQGSTSSVAGAFSTVQGDSRAISVAFTRSSGTFTVGNSVSLVGTASPILADANL